MRTNTSLSALVLWNVLAQDEVREVRLVGERVRLRQHAAERVPEQVDLAEPERDAHRLDVRHHRLDGIARGVLELLRTARAALVDEHQAVVARERQQVGEEVVVRGAGTAVEDDQGSAAADRQRVDQDAAGVHELLLDRVHRGGLRGVGRGRAPGRRQTRHDHHRDEPQPCSHRVTSQVRILLFGLELPFPRSR